MCFFTCFVTIVGGIGPWRARNRSFPATARRLFTVIGQDKSVEKCRKKKKNQTKNIRGNKKHPNQKTKLSIRGSIDQGMEWKGEEGEKRRPQWGKIVDLVHRLGGKCDKENSLKCPSWVPYRN